MKTPKIPFSGMQASPANHFKLYFYAAVLVVLERSSRSLGSIRAACEQFPFLMGYNNELAQHGLEGISSTEADLWWERCLSAWEESVSSHLPLLALRREAGLDHAALTMLLAIGLVEEDFRFGFLFEALQGTAGQPRPTLGLLNSWFENAPSTLRRLQELGLVESVGAELPRSSRPLQIPALLWEAMRGDSIDKQSNWVRHRNVGEPQAIAELVLPENIRSQGEGVASLLAAGECDALVIRGSQHNGRHAMAGALAKAVGRGLLEIAGLAKPEDERWKLVGPLATLLRALPAIALDLAPGETAVLPDLEGYKGPIIAILPKQGGISGAGMDHAVTLSLALPRIEERRQHWLRAFGRESCEDLDAISERFRLSSGNIERAARLAMTYARLENRTKATVGDLQQASRALNRQTLDTLARRVTVSGDWNQLAVTSQTLTDLLNLESRCRHRERLRGQLGSAFREFPHSGVRALFCGPSGTGKTLAAQLLAARLQVDLYRLDLSSVVNKYIGETEKNLSQIFARAEELDVALLLDEGDALLTQRTTVHTSNDRYANLETNYLLQRLESYEGILIVTTNAVERIDNAFQRRMDVVVNFRPPEALERWNIWQMHLPVDHEIAESLLNEIAGRCPMTGGQIRNAALYASVLALDSKEAMQSAHLESAVQHEYRKMGAVCPLRRAPVFTQARG